MDDLAPGPKPVPALVRAKRILDDLSLDGKAKGVSDIARNLALPKSTVHGLCRTLEELGLLVRTGANQFTVGPHVLAWANAYQSQSSLPQAFMELAEQAGMRSQSINLSIPSGHEVMYIACRQGSDPLGVSFRPGLRLPAPFTATGKAMLATMSDAEVRELFAQRWPDAWTPSSVPDIDALLAELVVTRARGYSLDDGQLRESMTCFGAPVFGAGSVSAVAGVAIGVLTADSDEDAFDSIAATVTQLAAQLTRRLGGRPRTDLPREPEHSLTAARSS
ncbi:MAG: IclR family transcriptional regulator, blcABC operon repressor [Actinomycetota bacterium]|jgi:DNA-binding IclR family transcriptional regulator|nr:IclR family transcriptional regulator, blcABC operon repressor [Actinomycetota bacterium]